MKFIHTILSVVWGWGDWDFCFDIDLCPLVMKVGVGIDLPEDDGLPERRISVNLPTIRFEFRWMKESDMTEWLKRIDC
jgi:hypothetical protein